MNSKILFYGSGWGRVLAELLLNYDVTTNYLAPTYKLHILLIEIIKNDVIMRVGMPPGAGGIKNILFDFYWILLRLIFRKKKFIYYWIGTDVMLATNENRGLIRNIIFDFEKSSNHISNAPWLKEELIDCGVRSDVILFPGTGISMPALSSLKWPKYFTVAAYIPDHRHDFYGGDEIIECARNLPMCNFLVFGGEGVWLDSPPENVKFMGRVDDMHKLYNSIHVLIRMVKHDAIGGTVREALFYGRHVIYSYNLSGVKFIAFGDKVKLLKELVVLQAKFLKGDLGMNLAGRLSAEKLFSIDNLIKSFLKVLQ